MQLPNSTIHSHEGSEREKKKTKKNGLEIFIHLIN